MNESLIGKGVSDFLSDSARPKRKHHILLLHEEPEYGRLIEYYFLKIGLEKGERSVYAILDTENIEAIEREMTDFGINVDKYKRANLLYIPAVPNPLEHPNGVMSGIQTALQRSLANIPPPYRLTDRLFSTPINRLESNVTRNILDTERSFHQSFQGQDIAAKYLCSYCVDDIGDLLSDSSGWTEGMLKSHQGVIYSTSTAELALRFH
jgi:hypothetical protein